MDIRNQLNLSEWNEFFPVMMDIFVGNPNFQISPEVNLDVILIVHPLMFYV